MMKTVLCCVFLLCLQGALCWDQEELDLFDLVEEIEENFYEVLGVEQSSSQSDIRRAYRQLSLKLHPDKSDDPDAAEKFRKLVAVSEVLKDEQKRAWYDLILVEGLPDWKQPLYYYRHVRKMGLFEMSVLVLVIASVGHYLFGWAVFVEKQLVLQEVLSRKQKKEKKTKKSTKPLSSKLEAELEYHTAQANASIPTLKNILPIILAKKSIALSKFCWSRYAQWKLSQPTKNETPEKTSECPEKTPNKIDKRKEKTTQNGRTKPKDELSVVGASTEEAGDSMYDSTSYESQFEAIMNDLDDNYSHKPKKGSASKAASNQEPLDEKPQATVNNSKANDSSKITTPTLTNGNLHSLKQSSSANTSAKPAIENASTHKPSKRNSSDDHPRTPLAELPQADPILEESSSVVWSQYQQKQLEWALGHYPKYSKDRWENVTKAVPGRTMEECIGRCKELFAAVRKRKLDSTDA